MVIHETHLNLLSQMKIKNYKHFIVKYVHILSLSDFLTKTKVQRVLRVEDIMTHVAMKEARPE